MTIYKCIELFFFFILLVQKIVVVLFCGIEDKIIMSNLTLGQRKRIVRTTFNII